ncbi:MAG: GEVED domain-containing protein, partial [Thiolinea sp.]
MKTLSKCRSIIASFTRPSKQFRYFQYLNNYVLLIVGILCFPGILHAALDVNKHYSPATLFPNEQSRMTIELFNSSVIPSTNVAFSDALPEGVFIAAIPNTATTCGGTVTTNNTATQGEITFSDGTIPAGDSTNSGTCSISVDIYAARKGNFVDSIAGSDVSGLTGSVTETAVDSAAATLAVILKDLTGTMNFSNVSGTWLYLQGYETAVETITINNPNPVDLHNLSFENNMLAYARNIRALDDGNQTSTCGGTITITPQTSTSSGLGDTTLVSFSGGTLPANASCAVSFTVEPTRDPTLPYYSANYQNQVISNNVSTDEGATNSASITHYVYTKSGIEFTNLFNGVETSLINMATENTARFNLTFTNYNTEPVNTFDFVDVLPTLAPLSGVMTVQSIDDNTCGGAVTTGTGNEVRITGGSLSGGLKDLPGFNIESCSVTATVSVNSAGTYQDSEPAGSIGGYDYNASTATLDVINRGINITKRFSDKYVYQGETTNLIITVNNMGSNAISNLRLTDELRNTCGGETPTACDRAYFRIDPAGTVANTCGGTLTANSNETLITLDGGAVAAGSRCEISIPVLSSADAYPIGRHYSQIPIGDITYDSGATTGITYPAIPRDYFHLYARTSVNVLWMPDLVASAGLTRLRTRVTQRMYDGSDVEDMFLSFNLPAGHSIAADPKLTNGCGGTVTATAGSGSVTLSGGSLSAGGASSTQYCDISVDVQSPALTSEEESVSVTISANAHDNPISFSARKVDELAPYHAIESYDSSSDQLTRREVALTPNLEFLQTAINGGGRSRVRVTFANTDAKAINLNNVSLNDSFLGTDIRLFSDPDPTFTDKNGLPNSNGCHGGVFNAPAGATTVGLSGARIEAGQTCYFEYNVTAVFAGNHINSISAGDITSREGVINDEPASATLTVGRQINVGNGFTPGAIATDEVTTLTISIYNTNDGGADHTGATPALTTSLPAGLAFVGTPVTSCAGGSLTVAADDLTLNGGSFPAEASCTVTAQVTTSTAGSYNHTIPTGALRTQLGATNPDATTAMLRVINKPTLSTSFLPYYVGENQFSRLRITVTNPNDNIALPAGMTNISFSNALSGGLVVASPATVSGSCTDLVHNVTAGESALTFSGIDLLPSGSCDIDFNVAAPGLGIYPNQTTGAVSDQNSNPGEASNTAILTVQDTLGFSKAFNPGVIAPNEISTLTFTLTNPNTSPVELNTFIAFTDAFPTAPAQMVVANPPNVATSCLGVSVRNLDDSDAIVAGDIGIHVEDGTVQANSSCTITVDVTAPADGNYDNVTSDLSSLIGSSDPAKATLIVSSANSDFGDAPAAYGVAEHTISPGLHLGDEAPDVEFSSSGNAAADADDVQGSDDEDGATLLPKLKTTAIDYTLNVRATNTITSDATLHGWVDFDRDGNFDADEYASALVSTGLTDSTVSLLWTGLNDLVAGNTYVRLRLSTEGLLQINANTPAGVAGDGEIEDHLLLIEDGGCSLVVTTTSDVDSAENESGSLRDAIECANANNGPDTITFNLPVSEPGYDAASDTWIISPTSALPALTDDRTTIDAETQPGAQCGDLWATAPNRTLKVQLDGAVVSASGYSRGLDIAGDNIDLRGLSVTNFLPGVGIYTQPGADNSRFTCNHIGVAADGMTAGSNSNGMDLRGTHTYLGDVAEGDGNIISGNSLDGGVGVAFNNADTSYIHNNFFGLGQDGSTAVPNRTALWNIGSGSMQIGGSAAGQANLFSGNSSTGISFRGPGTDNSLVQGNLIGTDKTGLIAAGNQTGISFGDFATGITLGGSGSGEGNVIAGNSNSGIASGSDAGEEASRNAILGNLIGLDKNAANALPNQDGIALYNVSDFMIQENTIARNSRLGILLQQGADNVVISRNSIYSNALQGIDLQTTSNAGTAVTGVTLNDAADADSGANALLNFPVLSNIMLGDDELIIQGCAPAGAVVEIFEADVSAGGSATPGANRFGLSRDYGEGEAYRLSAAEGSAADKDTSSCFFPGSDGNNHSGMNAFFFSVPAPADVAVNDSLTATSTLSGVGTSEFSPQIRVSDKPPSIGGGSCPVNGGTDILFIVDNSGSISSAEFSDFSQSIQDVGRSFLADNPNNRIGVAHFGGPSESLASGGQYVYLERDFSTTPMTAPVRRFGQGGTYNTNWFADHLAGAVHQMRYALDGNNATTSSFVISPLREMARDKNIPLQIVLMTDAARYGDWTPGDISMLIDPVGSGSEPNDGSDFTIYNQLKTENINFAVVSFNVSADASAAAAAISSVGGSYSGAVDVNNPDPEGSQTLPRRYVPVTSGFVLNLDQVAEIADSVAICGNNISGYVFEDTVYGGGNGRAFGGFGTVGLPDASIEVYDSNGDYVAAVNSGPGGGYRLPSLPDGDY